MTSLWFQKDCQQIPKIIDLLAIIQSDLYGLLSIKPASQKIGKHIECEKLVKLHKSTIGKLRQVYEIIQNTQSLFLADRCGWEICDKEINSCHDVFYFGIKTQIECETVIISKKDVTVKKHCEQIPINILLNECKYYKPITLKDFYEAICCLKEYFRDLCQICEHLDQECKA